jgi:uncharacterized membrane protein
MIGRTFRHIAGTWFTGLLVLLPAALTVGLLAWFAGFVYELLSPGSVVGQIFALLGMPFARNPVARYAIGTALLMGLIWLLGLLVQQRLRLPFAHWVRTLVGRIPVVGDLYDTAERFVGVLRRGQKTDLGAMSPVWCIFGGDGAAVLALAPNPEPLLLDGREYRAVLIPTAPVPIGGALIYVPAEWVRPAEIGVERLSAIYVSMGMNPPTSPPPRGG